MLLDFGHRRRGSLRLSDQQRAQSFERPAHDAWNHEALRNTIHLEDGRLNFKGIDLGTSDVDLVLQASGDGN